VTADLSSVGGSKNAEVWEGSIQEIDVATGKVIFEWHSLGNVGLDESY
jgi:outer membrane protein assembly factor BamB